MWKYDLALEKYLVIYSGYFRLTTTVALGTGITGGKLLFCRGISEGSVDKKISTKEYNSGTFYDCFNNPFPYIFGRPDLNLPPIIIDYRLCLDKRAFYTPDLLPAAISVASENSDGTFTTPSDSPQHLVINSYDPNHIHAMNKDERYHGRVKRG